MMNPHEIGERISALLRMNLLIDESTRQRLLAAPPELQIQAIPVVEKINGKEAEVLTAVMKKNPYLFNDLNREIKKADVKKLMVKENQSRNEELEELEDFLSSELAQV